MDRERRDARGRDVLQARLGAHRPQSCDYEQRAFDSEDVAIRGDAGTARVQRRRSSSAHCPTPAEEVVYACHKGLDIGSEGSQDTAGCQVVAVVGDRLHMAAGDHIRCPRLAHRPVDSSGSGRHVRSVQGTILPFSACRGTDRDRCRNRASLHPLRRDPRSCSTEKERPQSECSSSAPHASPMSLCSRQRSSPGLAAHGLA